MFTSGISISGSIVLSDCLVDFSWLKCSVWFFLVFLVLRGLSSFCLGVACLGVICGSFLCLGALLLGFLCSFGWEVLCVDSLLRVSCLFVAAAYVAYVFASLLAAIWSRFSCFVVSVGK